MNPTEQEAREYAELKVEEWMEEGPDEIARVLGLWLERNSLADGGAFVDWLEKTRIKES